MSVVAACSLIDGIIMGADCRATFREPGHEDIYVDNCLKLFVLSDSTVIGFVGSLLAASRLLTILFEQIEKHRDDPATLSHWLPRLFRHEYRRMKRPNLPVSFLVASTILGRDNVIERQAVVDLANYMFFSPDRKVKTTWFDAKVMTLLSTPPEATLIRIDAPLSLLLRLDSPDFKPRPFAPLHFVAIGSGEKLKDKIGGLRDMIFASDVGNYHMEAMWLGTAMESFLKEVNEKTVGGLFPMMKVDHGVVRRLGQNSKGHFPGGYDIKLVPTEASWIQKNMVTGKEISLIPPWEIDLPAESRKFDDVRYGIFG